MSGERPREMYPHHSGSDNGDNASHQTNAAEEYNRRNDMYRYGSGEGRRVPAIFIDETPSGESADHNRPSQYHYRTGLDMTELETPVERRYPEDILSENPAPSYQESRVQDQSLMPPIGYGDYLSQRAGEPSTGYDYYTAQHLAPENYPQGQDAGASTESVGRGRPRRRTVAAQFGRQLIQNVGDRVSDLSSQVRDQAGGLRSEIGYHLGNARDEIEYRLDNARDGIEYHLGNARDDIEYHLDNVSDSVRYRARSISRSLSRLRGSGRDGEENQPSMSDHEPQQSGVITETGEEIQYQQDRFEHEPQQSGVITETGEQAQYPYRWNPEERRYSGDDDFYRQ